MDALGRDPGRVRTIAKTLLHTPDHQFTDWEIDFLEKMATNPPDRLSTRQGEVLFELKEEVELFSDIGGIRVATLIRKAFEGRTELDEGDEEWIVRKYNSGVTQLRRGDLRRLKRCCIQLNELESYM
jgi:hypothetical protein